MCGIYGIFDPTGQLNNSQWAWAEEAKRRLKHRGPDGHRSRTLLDGHCLLGHLRLAIIDIEGGAQPISNEDGTIWVICNGEIYNYLELRETLLANGHRFSTHSDTEVLVHLFEEKGIALLEDLEGMYAFAIVDVSNRKMFLCRDRFGEKPLYWATIAGGRGLAFASEMKALLPLEGVNLGLDVAALAQFLTLNYIPAPRTHFKGIRKLRAGEAIILDSGQEPRVVRYWEPRFAIINGHKVVSKEAAVEEVRSRFREALRLRLRSDVPVGAFLSGGIDSTLVAITIRELLPSVSFTTFCASFDDQQLDEAPYARRIAEHVHSDHQEIRFSPKELLGIFDALIDHYDEPFADPSMFPTFAVCRAAREHCKVMLSGDGGDEIFGGYRHFFDYSSWQPVRRIPGVHSAANFVSRSWDTRWRGNGLLNFLGKRDQQLVYSEAAETATLASIQPEYRESASEGLDELRAAATEHMRLAYPLSAMEDAASSYLPEQILVKVDRASMFSGVECRTPFLDRSLFSFATSLPVGYHFSGGQGKALLRQCLPNWVPPEIRWRNKQGFTPPLAAWLRGSLRMQMEEAIVDISSRLEDLFTTDAIVELNRLHQAGADCSPSLFRWLVLSRRTRGATV